MLFGLQRQHKQQMVHTQPLLQHSALIALHCGMQWNLGFSNKILHHHLSHLNAFWSFAAMNECSIDDVAARFSEAVETGRRLPPVRVQGYFNVWPVFARKEWEGFADKDYQYRPLPPTPEAIDRMLETMRWVQWLEEEQRHLIWMRAKQREWKDICRRFGCDRTTAWRRWRKALETVTENLNLTTRKEQRQ